MFPNWGAFAFSRSAYQNCSVCPSVCMKHLENRWADFNRIWCWGVDPKCSHSLQFVSSVVSIVTKYGLDCPVSDFQQGKRLFLYPKRPVRLLDQPSLVFSGCWRLFRGGIWTLNLRTVPRWRMSGAVPFFPYLPSYHSLKHLLSLFKFGYHRLASVYIFSWKAP